MNGPLRICVALLFLLMTSRATSPADRPKLPPQGIVPDEITAVKIAEAVFIPIFGTEEVTRFLPYHAQFKEGVWTVYGTLKLGSLGGWRSLKA